MLYESIYKWGCAKVQFESDSQQVADELERVESCAKVQFESDSQPGKTCLLTSHCCAKVQLESDSQRLNQ